MTTLRNQFALWVLLAVLGAAGALAEDSPPQPGKKPAGDAAAQLAAQQAQVADRFRDLEKVLLRMAELTAQTDPRRAALLRQAIAQSKDRDLDYKFDNLVDLLKQDRLSAGVKNQQDVQAELSQLLELLLSEDRGKKVESEKQRLREYLRRLNQIIKSQKGLQAETAEGDEKEAKLGDRQGDLGERTGNLGKDIAKNEGPGPSAAKEPPAGKDPAGKDKPRDDENKNPDQDGKGKGAEGKNSKDKDPRDKVPRDKVPRDKDAKDKDAKGADKEDKDGKSADGQPKEPSAGKGEESPGEPKPGDDAKPGQPSPGQPSPGQPSQGQDNESAGGSSPPQQDDSPPAQKRLREAQERMEEAKKQLDEAKRQGAAAEQQKAIEALEKAKAELEAILRQLREEERSRMLAMLESRFRKMLDLQTRVFEGTKRLDRVPEPDRDRDHEIESGRLSRKEAEIVGEADRALGVLREEGSSVAMPEAVGAMREDMEQTTLRLAQGKVGEVTQKIEEDIITALEELIAALKKAQKDLADKKPPPGQPGGEPTDPPLVDKIAELKVIRAMQMRVNTRTQRYYEMIKTEQAEQPELLTALKRLAEREERIHRVTRDIVVGRNE